MKNKLFIAIALLMTVFFFGCNLNMTSDADMKAALADSTANTVDQSADTEIPVEFSDGTEIPVEFSDGTEIPVEFSDGTEIPVEFTGGYEIPVEFAE